MTTPDDLIASYLRDLEAATAGLPSAARADLLSDLRDHLEEVRRHGGEVEVRDALDRLGSPAEIAASARETEGVTVGGAVPPPPPPATATAGVSTTSVAWAPDDRNRPSVSSGVRDTWTVLLLLLGPLALAALFASVNRALLVLGLVVGIAVSWALLWTSRTWTTPEKVLGTAVWPGGFVTPLVLSSVVTSVCTEEVLITGDGVQPVTTVCDGFSLPLWLGLPTAGLLWLAPIAVGVFLLHRGNRRRAEIEGEERR